MMLGTILVVRCHLQIKQKDEAGTASAAVIFSHRDPISNGVWCYITLEYTTFSYICLSALEIDLCALMKVTRGKILSSSDIPILGHISKIVRAYRK
jgi:hypothetical protein